MVQADFKAMERSGWSERAAIYNDYTGTLCRQAIAPLLHEGEVAGSHAVLDGGCGTGAAAAEAARLGASVTAVDFSDDMVEVARARCPGAAVCAGDAEALVFEDASFDRVVCNFGILHVADPDRAIAEAARVLKSGGRYAFTAWRGPEVSPFFRIVMDAVSESGTLDVDLPPAPPMFRFSDEAECARTLRAAGSPTSGAQMSRSSWSSCWKISPTSSGTPSSAPRCCSIGRRPKRAQRSNGRLWTSSQLSRTGGRSRSPSRRSSRAESAGHLKLLSVGDARSCAEADLLALDGPSGGVMARRRVR